MSSAGRASSAGVLSLLARVQTYPDVSAQPTDVISLGTQQHYTNRPRHTKNRVPEESSSSFIGASAGGDEGREEVGNGL